MPRAYPPEFRRRAVELARLREKPIARIAAIGEQPGVSDYCCTNCNWRVHLDDATDRLPPCGSCGRGQQTSYERC